MNKIFYTTLLFFAVLLHAAEQKGIDVKVELLSGTSQKAQFLGIENDTVSLGGYIKDKFTVIRIAKNQFKSIVDAQGKDLLKQDPPKEEPPKTEQPQAATKEPPKDSATASPNETQISSADSSAQVEETQPDTASAQRDFEGNKIFAGFEHSGTLQQKAQVFSAMTSATLTEIDSSYIYADRNKFNLCDDNTCLQKQWRDLGASEIIFGKLSNDKNPDSLEVQLTRVVYEDTLPTISMVKAKVSSAKSINDAMSSDKLKNLVSEALGEKKEEKNLKSYIHVETDPEGATVSRPENDAICKTPCTFVTLDTGKIVLNAYWKVEHLWGTQTTVRAIPGDTVKVSLKLKKIAPEIRVMTHPAKAEIYTSSEEITKKSTPIAYTPDKFVYTDPGMASIRLRREGYRDTLVKFYLAPVPETTLDIELEELKDFNEIETQKEWIRSRNIYKLGKTLMGASLAPIIVGSIFLYLGQRDYNDADDLKEELKLPGNPEGPNFKKKIAENRDLAHSGNRKVIAGSSLIGAGIILFGIGLYLTF